MVLSALRLITLVLPPPPSGLQTFKRDTPPELLLLHPSGGRNAMPEYIEMRRKMFGTHHHIREGATNDIKRLARFVGGSAVSIVMAGGGVREETVQEVVHRSGVDEVHVRGTKPARNETGAGPALKLRKPLPADEGAWEETDERRIREFVRLANG